MQKVCRLCATKTGTQIGEPMQAGETGHSRIWKDVTTECERMENRRAKKKGHQEGMQKASGRV